MKTALKSFMFDKVTDKNKLARFLWLTVYTYAVLVTDSG